MTYFNFTKIEDKSVGVSPVVPVIMRYINADTNEEKSPTILSDTALQAVLNVCRNKKLKLLDDYVESNKKTQHQHNQHNKKKKHKHAISKKDIIVQRNADLMVDKAYESISKNKHAVFSDITHYILQAVLICTDSSYASIIGCEHIIRICFTFDNLSKEGADYELFGYLASRLRSRTGIQSQFECMERYPHLYHSCNLIGVSESIQFRLFKHQKDFARLLRKSTLDVIVNSSPVGSGKTVLQTFTAMLSHKKNASCRITENQVAIITCANRFVLEEIARCCNAENTVAYWFYYDGKLTPSLFCHPRRKNGSYHIIQKPGARNSSEEQYSYWVTKHYEIKNNKSSYNKIFYMPDVIFAMPVDALELLTSEFRDRVWCVVIDEFMIPGSDMINTLDIIRASTSSGSNITKLALLSASAPTDAKGFRSECSDIYNILQDTPYNIHVIFEEVIPSFIRFSDVNTGTGWLPTNSLDPTRFEEQIRHFSWYHYRFFPPTVVQALRAIAGVTDGLCLEEQQQLVRPHFMSIKDMIRDSREFLESLCSRDIDTVKRVCAYVPPPTPAGTWKDLKNCMFICEDPVIRMRQLCADDIHEATELIAHHTDIEIANKKQHDDMCRALSSLKRMRFEDMSESSQERQQDLEEAINDMEKNCSVTVSIKNGVNRIPLPHFISVFRDLTATKFFTKQDCDTLMTMLLKGCVLQHSSIPKSYFKVSTSKNFITVSLFVSQSMAYGTDTAVSSVVCFEDMDAITTVQAFGRAGRSRDQIEVPVYAPIESCRKLVPF